MTLKPSSVSILQIPTVTGMLFATTEYWRLIHKMVSALLFVTLTYEWSEVDASQNSPFREFIICISELKVDCVFLRGSPSPILRQCIQVG